MKTGVHMLLFEDDPGQDIEGNMAFGSLCKET